MPGLKRSRALWDNARRPHDSNLAQIRAWLRALCYELQPFRFQTIELDAAWLKTTKHLLGTFLTSTIPWLARQVYNFIQNLTIRQWLWVVGAVVYWQVVKYVHVQLHAGPFVLMMTGLVVIFTIGLSDNADQSGFSAYSVFNRGFERLLGSIDADALVAQHVGGGMMMPLQQQQQQQQQEPIQEQPPAEEPQQVDEPPEQDEAPPQQQNTARRSGKKARRQNLEQRREMRRQREAAIAMGFDGGQEDVVAMQRLIEDQVAAAEEEEE